MAYDIKIADRVRDRLSQVPGLQLEEKKMFAGLAFMINGKMCINISGDKLMCRFHPSLTETLAERQGFEPMVMKGKTLNGYCYVSPEGFKSKKDFDFWLNLCLAYNDEAKSSKKKTSKKIKQ